MSDVSQEFAGDVASENPLGVFPPSASSRSSLYRYISRESSASERERQRATIQTIVLKNIPRYAELILYYPGRYFRIVYARRRDASSRSSPCTATASRGPPFADARELSIIRPRGFCGLSNRNKRARAVRNSNESAAVYFLGRVEFGLKKKRAFLPRVNLETD